MSPEARCESSSDTDVRSPSAIRDKLEARVQALLVRKEQKGLSERSRRERSASFASSAQSRAPSDFFAHQDMRMLPDGDDSRESLTSFLGNDSSFHTLLPGALGRILPRKFRSAEPPASSERDSASYVSTMGSTSSSARQARTASHPLRSTVSEQGSLRSTIHPYDRPSTSLYPSLHDLTREMNESQSNLSIRGSKVKARVDLFQTLEQESSLDAIRSMPPSKRKAEAIETGTPNKRARF